MITLLTLTTADKVFVAIIFLLLICLAIFKFYTQEEYEWYSQNYLPENPREDRDISEDVLVYDYDKDCNIIGYYCYREDKWAFINYQETPKNFKWRYFDIEIDEP